MAHPPVDPARISALLEPFLGAPLPATALDQISTYIDLLLRWNARINLTAVCDPEHIVTRHFGESLFLARNLFPTPADRTPPSPEAATGAACGGTSHPRDPAAQVSSQPEAGSSKLAARSSQLIDIGSGAGFPALPLKIWAPEVHLTMIEANHKKAAFLREVVRALTLTYVNVITDRAESLAGRLSADLVTFRAVEHFDTIVPVAAQFLAPAARLAVLIGAAQIPTLMRLTPHLSWTQPIPIPQSESRVAVISRSL